MTFIIAHLILPRPLRSFRQRSYQRLGLALGGVLWGMGGCLGPAGLATISAPSALAQPPASTETDTLYHHPRIIIYPRWPYPRPVPQSNLVRVEFDAQGADWGAVYLDGRLIYRPHNFNRQETIYLRPGGYRLEVTGVVQADLWDSGYLDIGRDESRLVVIRFSKARGVQVAGPPYVWIPDE